MAGELLNKVGESGWRVVSEATAMGAGVFAYASSTQTISVLMTANESKYPVFEAKLTIGSQAPTKNVTVDLYIRPQADILLPAPNPNGTYEPFQLGSFVLDDVADSTYYLFQLPNLDNLGTFYLKSNESETALVGKLSIRMQTLAAAE